MGQWILQWGWALISLLVSEGLAMMAYRQAQSLIEKSGGDWKMVVLYVFGPFAAFCIMIGLMAVTFPWAISTIYGVVQNSAVSQSFYQLGSAGVSALGGTLSSVQVSIPEAPSFTDVLVNNIPSEADLRNVLVGGNSGQQSAPVSAPAAQQSTWTAPASGATARPAATPVVGVHAAQPDYDGAISPDEIDAQAKRNAAQGEKARAEATRTGNSSSLNGNSEMLMFGNGGGGPLAADADAAIAQAGVQTYTVKRGDYATKIAAQFGIAASVLCRANGIRDCNNLRVGIVLTIPAK